MRLQVSNLHEYLLTCILMYDCFLTKANILSFLGDQGAVQLLDLIDYSEKASMNLFCPLFSENKNPTYCCCVAAGFMHSVSSSPQNVVFSHPSSAA